MKTSGETVLRLTLYLCDRMLHYINHNDITIQLKWDREK